jgi:hypothetical protein
MLFKLFKYNIYSTVHLAVFLTGTSTAIVVLWKQISVECISMVKTSHHHQIDHQMLLKEKKKRN